MRLSRDSDIVVVAAGRFANINFSADALPVSIRLMSLEPQFARIPYIVAGVLLRSLIPLTLAPSFLARQRTSHTDLSCVGRNQNVDLLVMNAWTIIARDR